MNLRFIKTVGILTFLLTATLLKAQITTQFGPDGFVKIENGSGGFNANLDSGDRFSRDHDQAGDINGDGIIDLVVGARSDDDGATDAGAVYILFMNNDGTIQSNQKISMLEGGFTDTLNTGNFFGYGVAGIGDYDNDGIPDIAVSAPAPPNRALYIIHLNANGTVKDFVKNTNITAQGLSAIGDINNDGRIDLVACDPGSDIGGTNIGAIRILFLNNNSKIMPAQTVLINPTSGGFGSGLVPGDQFGGREVAMLGDIDNDGTNELAVGAFMSDAGKGAIWILSLDNTSHNVVSKLKITEGLNGFTDTLTTGTNPNGTSGANFGHALCKVGDLNGDGVPDLMTGANQQNEGWGYILYLNSNKTVKTFTRINNTDGGFGLTLNPTERFSRSISFIGDLRGDGTVAVNYGGGAGGTGTLYLLFLKPCDFTQQPGYNRWSGGTTLFSNWNHPSQTLTSDSLTFEQCTFKAFETDAPYMTYNFNDGRCICKDSNAVLIVSTELSTAFSNECSSAFILGSTDLSIRFFLEGIYDTNTGLMNDDLRDKGLLPFSDPWGLSPDIPAPAMALTGNNALVDWVLLEIRDPNDLTTKLYTTSGLLQRDGDVVDVDGSSLLSVDIPLPENAYIVVRQQNHLIAMSPSAVPLVNNSLSYDFSVQDSYSIPGAGQKELSTGIWGLIAGDANQDKDINGDDNASWESENGFFNIYSINDFNLDGDINGADKALWQANNGAFSSVPGN